MAIIDINDAYILNETGAQVDKVTGLFYKDESTTDAEKAFAQLNIGASGGGGGGRNLLDNPWFGSGEVVNQRGVTSGSTPDGTYTIDRWFTTYYGTGGASGSYSVGANGITITPSGSAYCGFAQKLASTLVAGKNYTLSAMLDDGTVISATKAFAASNFVWFEASGLRAQYIASTNAIRIYPNVSLTIRAVKLELGSTSTLAQDVPPDYGTELAKCMRYFQRIKGTSTNYAPVGLGFTTSASSGVIAAVLVPLPVPLRATAITVAKSGNLSLLAGSTSYTPSAITYYDHTEQQLRLNVTASGMTAGQFCYLQFSQSAAYIDLSADL